MNIQFLLDNFIGNKSNVLERISRCRYKCTPRTYYDFLTVIPKYGRQKHLHNVMQSWKASVKNSENSHRLVVVEHSDHKEAYEMCSENDVDYVFLPKDKDLFNKCLSMNIGSFIHDSKYIHFHDVDLWIPNNFWSELKNNMHGREVTQSFTGKRVNYINEYFTNKIFEGQMTTEQAISQPNSFTQGRPGAPGGSLVIKRNLFNNIGGFDPYYFWAYSIEDQFFVDKVEMFTKFYGCNNPPIEMFHFWHPSNEKATPLPIRNKGLKTRNYFIHLNLNDKKKLVKMFEEFLKAQEQKVYEHRDNNDYKIN